ncbi:MAG: PilW family protein [Polyangiales bacterium]
MMSRTRSHEGFTLIELMVALVAGLIAIGSVYTISKASSQSFHEQQRISQAQMATRMAVEQIRLDVQRAGFLGSANTATERTCLPMPDGQNFGAIQVLHGADTDALPNAAANGVQADRVTMVGNYATTSRYVVASAIGTLARLDGSTQGFRDSFGIPGTDFDAALFNDVFRTGRYLHIEDTDGDHFFLRITGTDPSTLSINFTPSLNSGSGNCVSGALRQAFISPLMRVEYAVVDASDASVNLNNIFGNAAQQQLDQQRGTVPSVLIRREVAFDPAASPIPNSERIVLDFVANFDVDIIADTNGAPGLPPTIVRMDDLAAQALTLNNPQQVRSVVIDIANRTADQDESFPFVPRVAGAPLTRYQVAAGRPGAARVRGLRAEIFLPNVL